MSSATPDTPTPPSLANKMTSLFSNLSSKASQAATDLSSSIPFVPFSPSSVSSLGFEAHSFPSSSSLALLLSTSQHPALDSIQHQLRSFAQHHVAGSTPISTRALQLAVTSQKGLALDLLSCSRDGSLASKELYEWSKTLQEPDLVDGEIKKIFPSYVVIRTLPTLLPTSFLSSSQTHSLILLPRFFLLLLALTQQRIDSRTSRSQQLSSQEIWRRSWIGRELL